MATLPKKISTYFTLRGLGFDVKPAHFYKIDGSDGKHDEFIGNMAGLLDIYPNVQLRTAGYTEVVTPNRRNLTTPQAIERAFHDLRHHMISNGLSDGYIFGWNFFPDKDLLSINFQYKDDHSLAIEMGWDLDHNEMTKGGAPEKLFYSLENIGTRVGWKAKNPELEGLGPRELEDCLEARIPYHVRRAAFERIIPPYIMADDVGYGPERLRVPELMGRNMELIIETVTQFGNPFGARGYHFVTDYEIIPRPI